MGDHARLVALLAGLALSHGWSFKGFLEGDWDLERQRAGVTTHARYELKSAADAHPHQLKGSYFEYSHDESAHSNEMRVEVDFDDVSGLRGSFKLARSTPAASEVEWDEGSEEPPEPIPQPPLRAVFEFDFSSRQDGAFWISESRWLGSTGGSLQVVAMGEDAFVISQVSPFIPEEGTDVAGPTAVAISTWTATRRGVKRAAAVKPQHKSILQRWGYTLGGVILLLGYQVYKK